MKNMHLSRIIVTSIFIANFSTVINAAEKGGFSNNQICKAGIATIMGRDPKIINIDRSNNGVIYLSYNRTNDGKKFSYKCKLEENRIVWSTDTGRWRTHPLDSKVIFNVKGNAIHIEDQFSDGSTSKKIYSFEQLNK